MKQALIELSIAFCRFQRVVDALGRSPQEVAAHGLNAINTVAVFNNNNNNNNNIQYLIVFNWGLEETGLVVQRDSLPLLQKGSEKLLHILNNEQRSAY